MISEGMTPSEKPNRHPTTIARLWEVLVVATRLGLTSFGGPVAHLGYFRDEYVGRRKWLDDHTYTDIVALCQFLPGPASSQVGIAVGITRAGLLGGLLAWIGFTLPSAIALTVFAYGVSSTNISDAGWLSGLKVVAVSVVALAIWNMARNLCPDRSRATVAILATVAVLAIPTALSQIAVIFTGGVLGLLFLRQEQESTTQTATLPISRTTAVVSFSIFILLLFGLPLLTKITNYHPIEMFDSFFRAGALVFGGGHVVLPLLQAEVVSQNWVAKDAFVAGYAAAQGVPGPLFTFSAYLGTLIQGYPAQWIGGLVALTAIFLPSFLLVTATLPFWNYLRGIVKFRRALMGINAAVVGLLIAALYDLFSTSQILEPIYFGMGLGAFLLLAFWKVPPWIVLLVAALVAQLISVI